MLAFTPVERGPTRTGSTHAPRRTSLSRLRAIWRQEAIAAQVGLLADKSGSTTKSGDGSGASRLSSAERKSREASAFPTQEFLHSRTDFIGTVAPRVGVAWDRTLLYVKGGAAWTHDKYWLTAVQAPFAGETFATGDATRWGWMVGVGVEYAFAQNWSVKAEYNYMDFGTERVFFASNGIEPTQPNFEEDIGRTIQVVKVGLNYKFDWGGPLVGRY